MKKLLLAVLQACCTILFAQSPNIDFELTSPGVYSSSTAVTNWTVQSGMNTNVPGVACTGTVAWVGGSPELSVVATPILGTPWPGFGLFSIDNVNIPNSPLGGNNVLRLQNNAGGYSATKVRNTFGVTTSNAQLAYAFCGSWEGGDACCNAPSFQVKLYNCSDVLMSCLTLSIIPSGPACTPNSINTLSVTNGTSWTNWQVKYIDLSSFIGSCVTVELLVNDCSLGGHHGCAYFDAKFNTFLGPCSCMPIPGLNKDQVSFCPGSTQAVIQGPLGWSAYQWYAPGPTAISPAFGGNTSAVTITNAAVGTVYTLQVMSGTGCIFTSIDTLKYSSVSVIGVGTNSSCAGGASGSASVLASGSGTGYNYAWYGPSGPSPISTASTIANVAPGVYTVGVSAISSAGCGSAVVTVTVGSKPKNSYSIVKPFCGNTAYLSNPLPGTNFKWYNNNTLIPALQGGTAPGYTANPVATGSVYRLRYQSNLGCQDSVIFLLAQVTGSLYATSNQLICPGTASGSAVMSLTTAPATSTVLNFLSLYSLPGMTSYSFIPIPPPASAYTVTGLVAGNYSIQAFNGDCLFSASVIVTAVNNTFAVSPISTTLCPGGNVLAGVSIPVQQQPQYTYTWTPNQFLAANFNNSPATLITPSTVPSGIVSTLIYTVTVTPTLINCPASQTLAITSINFPTPTLTAIPALCQNGPTFAMSANPPGGSFFNSTNGSVNAGGIITPSLAAIGINTVSYSQMPGTCADYAVSFTVNAAPTVSINGTTSICKNESSTLTASGAITYSWTTGALSSSIVITPTASALFTATGTSSAGCSATNTIFITVKSLPNVGVQGNTVICQGGSTQLTANGATTYLWNNNSTSASINVSPTTTTSYTVTGLDVNGCPGTQTVTVMVSICTGIETPGFANENMKVYPNPLKDELFLELTTKTEVALYDELGNLVLKTNLKNGRQRVDMSHYSKGIYLLELRQAGAAKVIKLAKTE